MAKSKDKVSRNSRSPQIPVVPATAETAPQFKKSKSRSIEPHVPVPLESLLWLQLKDHVRELQKKVKYLVIKNRDCKQKLKTYKVQFKNIELHLKDIRKEYGMMSQRIDEQQLNYYCRNCTCNNDYYNYNNYNENRRAASERRSRSVASTTNHEPEWKWNDNASTRSNKNRHQYPGPDNDFEHVGYDEYGRNNEDEVDEDNLTDAVTLEQEIMLKKSKKSVKKLKKKKNPQIDDELPPLPDISKGASTTFIKEKKSKKTRPLDMIAEELSDFDSDSTLLRPPRTTLPDPVSSITKNSTDLVTVTQKTKRKRKKKPAEMLTESNDNDQDRENTTELIHQPSAGSENATKKKRRHISSNNLIEEEDNSKKKHNSATSKQPRLEDTPGNLIKATATPQKDSKALYQSTLKNFFGSSTPVKEKTQIVTKRNPNPTNNPKVLEKNDNVKLASRDAVTLNAINENGEHSDIIEVLNKKKETVPPVNPRKGLNKGQPIYSSTSSTTSSSDDEENNPKPKPFTTPNLLECDSCWDIFTSQQELDAHELKLHNPAAPKSKLIGKKDKKATPSNNNKNKDTEVENPFKCDKCDYSGNLRIYLMKHMREVHGGKTYKCKLCSNTYRQMKSLPRHMKKVHNKEMKENGGTTSAGESAM